MEQPDSDTPPVPGARAFAVPAETYDAFMGRYSRPLAAEFAGFAQAAAGQRALDVGSGPGALTGELVRLLGAEAVSACDPSPSFVAACTRRHPGVEVRHGCAEGLPFGDEAFDLVICQLVLQLVVDPAAAASDMKRVTAPGGAIAACVWDYTRGMQMLHAFWDTALNLDGTALDGKLSMGFGGEGEIAEWLTAAGLRDVTETTLTVTSTYDDFDELWAGFLTGVGPAGSYCVSLPPDRLDSLRRAFHDALGAPTGPLTLGAVARAGRGIRPPTS